VHRYTLLLTIPLSLLVGSCQPADPSDSTPDSPPEDGVLDTGLQPAAAKASADPEARPEGWEAMVRERLAAEVLAITPRSGAFAAALPSLGLTAWLNDAGVSIADEEGEILALRTVEWGRADALQPLDGRPTALGECTRAQGAMGDCIRRLEYDSPGLTEWWVNLGTGLEQGWWVPEAPAGAGSLVIDVAIDGALDVDVDGETATITDATGRAWSVSGVDAWDATGDPLVAQLVATEQGLRIEVDDQGAAYPIEIDPVYTTATTTLDGQTSGEKFGYAVSGAGDVNNDGYDDIIVGAYAYDSTTGRAYVYHGSASGIASTATSTLDGAAASTYFGFSVSGAGDVDGDGYDDVIVGAYRGTSAYLFHGSASGVATTATSTLSGGSTFGFSVSDAGDVDGDGYDDVIVGAYVSIYGAGDVYVYHGSASGVVTTAVTTLSGISAYGYSVAGAGDVDGDGYDDVIVGAYTHSDSTTNNGQVYVHHGSASGVATAATTTITGTTWSGWLGKSVDGAGDVNGDGYDDVVMGEPWYGGGGGSRSGRLQIYYGSASGVDNTIATVTDMGETYEAIGQSVSGAGDVDGDGYDDVIAGTAAGYAYIYHGSASGVDPADSTFIPRQVWDQCAVSGAGDVDGDGLTDVVVGEWYYDTNTGRVSVYHGYVDDDRDGLPVDSDCDDTDASVGVASTWYADGDGDGFGDVTTTTDACDQPTGFVADTTDCDDTDADTFPGAAEFDSAEDCMEDGDDDGYGEMSPASGVTAGTDCDDAEATANPAATEYCDSIDNDCDGSTDEDDAADASTWYADSDGDSYGDAAVTDVACSAPTGYVAGVTDGVAFDCDDGVAAVNPAATEYCDSIDNDCDGTTDEDDAADASTWYADNDGDSYGDAAVTDVACSAPTGFIADSTDCDDSEATTNPAATEYCDGHDDDCDGTTDEDDAADASTWYVDSDGDSYGDAAVTDVECSAPTGFVADASDCDDGAAAVNPAATELCDSIDNDCDGTTDEDDAADASTWYADADADSYGDAAVTDVACSAPTGYVAGVTDGVAFDCDDGAAAVNPAATELCDSIDNDCDGTIDEDDAADTTTWYADSDGDSYGDAGVTDVECSAPTGYVADATDCDDGAAAVNPAATELCDSIDNDCDGTTDEDDAADASTWYADSDGDSYGDAAVSDIECSAPTGFVAGITDGVAFDCDDATAAVNPAATELCDGIDNDCDGTTDEDDAADAGTWYADSDGDSYGDAAVTDVACSAPTGFVADSTDCDDAEATTNPAATELCDGHDDDCDGTTDEDDAADASTWYADSDGDGYGDAAVTDVACSAPTGFVADDTDCDDATAAVNPTATEQCDSIDNDCDGLVDDDDSGISGTTTWYLDYDGDGYGASSRLDQNACLQPSGYVADDTDCDDMSAAVNPVATELCDSIDNDCDGTIDEDDAADALTWYADSDGDSYGDAASTTAACALPSGYVADSTDCDDSEATTHPGATEYCDSIDNDCDGSTDEDDAADALTWYADTDGDSYGDATSTTAACSVPSGYVADDTDCDDGAAAVNPAATELCDSVDNDCDADVDEDDAADALTWYADSDGDSYGDATSTTAACAMPSGYVADDTDCDDGDGAISPAAEEICDSFDNDCDGDTDEDGVCDAEIDSDGDGVLDGQDIAPLDPMQCSDWDEDGCDDCLTGSYDPVDECDDGIGSTVDVCMPDVGCIHTEARLNDGICSAKEANCNSSNDCGVDSDGDGLSDDWETLGIDMDGDGTIDLDLPALGADPLHQDLFIEVDYMVGDGYDYTPDQAAMDEVVQAFADAPVDNPDGITGITVHLEIDQEIPYIEVVAFGQPATAEACLTDDFIDFYDLKARYFDVRRTQVYHYVVFAGNNGYLEKGTSGRGEVGGNDFLVTLNSDLWYRWNRGKIQAGTFMHELGHNLGLRHGGDDNVSYKPNYVSVMNYWFQLSWLKSRGGPYFLDFSREHLATLDESGLDETVGISTALELKTKYYCGRYYRWSSGGSGIDWDCVRPLDGDVEKDLNNKTNASPGEQLDGHDDWSNLDMAFQCRGGFSDGDAPKDTFHDDELELDVDTVEELGLMRELVEVELDVMPGCASNPLALDGSTLEVLVYGQDELGVDELDQETLVFALASPDSVNIADVDADGLDDLTMVFDNSELQLVTDSDSVMFTAWTSDGSYTVQGEAPIQVVSDAAASTDICDNCPDDPTGDSDLDEVCDQVDNCPETENTDQSDLDGDGLGDACDTDPGEPGDTGDTGDGDDKGGCEGCSTGGTPAGGAWMLLLALVGLVQRRRRTAA